MEEMARSRFRGLPGTDLEEMARSRFGGDCQEQIWRRWPGVDSGGDGQEQIWRR